MVDFATTMAVSASGLRAQTDRMKTIAENIANANSTAKTPDGDPYRRKVPAMESSFDRTLGATVVKSNAPIADQSAFPLKYDPGNPIANAQGYVKQSNVEPLTEIMDMREAQRSYEAGLNVMDVTKSMQSQTVNLLSK